MSTPGIGDYGDKTKVHMAIGEYVGDVYIWHTLLGEIDFACFGNQAATDCPVFFASGGGGITKVGGTTREHVYFGFGDGWIYNNSAQGVASSLPDLYTECLPEPTSIMLLGLAGFLLRRR